MKTRNIFIVIGLFAVSLFSATSCKDMLEVDTGDKSYKNANDTLYSYLGIMKCVQNLAERQVILNELRGDLTASTEYVTDTLHAIANFDDPEDGSCSMLNISDYYAVINNCNLYIANADTNKVKSNNKYMIPEYAQVQAVRAWTYLQLVNIYGEVPFISEPISNLDVVKNFDYKNNLVNKDNLVDKFLDLGITSYLDTNYPSYGNYNNGATNISSRLLYIPVRLVLADMYLLRGASKSDYQAAATYYYEWLRRNNAVVPSQYCTASFISSMNEFMYANNNGWGSWGSNYTYSASGEVISIIPSSANKQFGTMLLRVSDIFGFTPTSSQNNETTTNDDGEEESNASGAISVIPTYKAQIVPSNGYKALNEAQTYVHWNTTNLARTYYEDAEDARYTYSTYRLTYEGESYTLAAKAARGMQFYYSIPIYRKTVVWLRLAEAINRSGYPGIAFAILKDGLNNGNWPETGLEREVYVPIVDEEGNYVLDEDGNIQYATDEEGNLITVTETYTRYAANGAMHYVSEEELETFYLDFSDEIWASNYGIHARGCGHGSWTRTTTTSPVVTNLTGYYDDEYYDWDPLMRGQGVDEDASQDDIINAVENIICDELALEAAFEGYRFSDLVRMANHKNASGYNGTEWLATKIGDRNVREASEDGTVTEITRDEELYSKLHNTSLWYMTKPAWSVE